MFNSLFQNFLSLTGRRTSFNLMLTLVVNGVLTRFQSVIPWGDRHVEHLLLWPCKYLHANKYNCPRNFEIWMLKHPLLAKNFTIFFFFTKKISPHENNFIANRIQINQFYFLWTFEMLTNLWDTWYVYMNK